MAPLLPNDSPFPMSRHHGITEKRFWNLPAIGSVPAVTQAQASDNISVATPSSQRHSQPVARSDGCMITRFSDLSNECAHFVSAVRAKNRQSEKDRIIDLLVDELVPVTWGGVFSIVLHKHHDNWATIAISPCLADMIALTQWFSNDNAVRQRYLSHGRRDPGRSHPAWFDTLPLQNEFQLTLLHPNHFHSHAQQSLLVLGTDGHSKQYKASPDGVLKDENDVPLPPFPLPSRNVLTKLNPILVNFAAALRFRRLKRMDPALMQDFSTETLAVIDASLQLYAAVMWTPVLPNKKKGSVITVESADAADIDMGAGPSGTSGSMKVPQDREAEEGSVEAGSSWMDTDVHALFETLGAEQAMDVLLGGYDFEPLPDLGHAEDSGASPPWPTTSPDKYFEPLPELIHDGENGGASPPRPTTPPDDEERWDVVSAEVLGTGRKENETEVVVTEGDGAADEGLKGGRVCDEAVVVGQGELAQGSGSEGVGNGQRRGRVGEL
ncbi:hypothetical protein B0H13DRAFT_2100344 [Mycena leptocephala]|nr:hypothetical protein B0H13DRAFT_2100344 [Mycena leptocephala]